MMREYKMKIGIIYRVLVIGFLLSTRTVNAELVTIEFEGKLNFVWSELNTDLEVGDVFRGSYTYETTGATNILYREDVSAH